MKTLLFRAKEGWLLLYENGSYSHVSFDLQNKLTNELNIQQKAMYGQIEEVEVIRKGDKLEIIRRNPSEPYGFKATVDWIEKFPFLEDYATEKPL